MTTPERGLFERIEKNCTLLNSEAARVKKVCQKFEQRLAEAERDARNRDMWKGQCERQAEELTRLRARCGELEKIIDAKNEALYICASHNRLHLGGSHNTVRVAEDALAIAATPQPAQEQTTK